MSELQQNLDYVTLEVDGSTYKVIALTSGGRGHISAYLRNGYKDASLLRTAKHYSEHFEVIATETPAAPVEETPLPTFKPGDKVRYEITNSDYTVDEIEDDTAWIKGETGGARCVSVRLLTLQPAQPLAALEALRAENAALRENCTNYEMSIDALKNGMKEKDAAFNELMAERNQLQAALVDARSLVNLIKRAQLSQDERQRTLKIMGEVDKLLGLE